MIKPILSIKFFSTALGKEPVKRFLLDQTFEDRKLINEEIKTVQFGWPLGMPLVRKMEKDLWEIRVNINDGIVRVFFTIVGVVLILLHGFVKKSQQTPKKELEIARQRLKLVRRGIY